MQGEDKERAWSCSSLEWNERDLDLLKRPGLFFNFSKLCPSSCGLGEISLEIKFVGVKITRHERKKIHSTGMGECERWWCPEGTQSLSSAKCTAVLSLHFPSVLFHFCWWGKIRLAQLNHQACMCFSMWALQKIKGSEFTSQRNWDLPRKSASSFLPRIAAPYQWYPFTMLRKSWNKVYVVSIYLHLVPSNWPSVQALRQGTAQCGGPKMTDFLPIMPCSDHT